nr:hypothetical protein [uncultured Rhodopila sp.]
MKHVIPHHGAGQRNRNLIPPLRVCRSIIVVALAGPGIGTALATDYAPVATLALTEDGRLAQPAVNAAARPDQDVESLLNQLLRQLADGRTATPDGDNAMATWKILLNVVIPPTPGAARAMSNFVREAQRRAAEEQAAGRAMTAMQLTLFASEASDILQGERAEPPPATITANRPEPDPFAEIHPSDAALPVDPAPIGGRVTLASRDAPKVPSPSGTQPATPGRPVPPPGGPGQAGAAVSRGDAMLAMKDISAARALYEYAANAGSARGARALAETYDPDFLRRLGAIGPKPDLALAAAWYRKAASLGDDTAEAKVRLLAAEAAR